MKIRSNLLKIAIFLSIYNVNYLHFNNKIQQSTIAMEPITEINKKEKQIVNKKLNSSIDNLKKLNLQAIFVQLETIKDLFLNGENNAVITFNQQFLNDVKNLQKNLVCIIFNYLRLMYKIVLEIKNLNNSFSKNDSNNSFQNNLENILQITAQNSDYSGINTDKNLYDQYLSQILKVHALFYPFFKLYSEIKLNKDKDKLSIISDLFLYVLKSKNSVYIPGNILENIYATIEDECDIKIGDIDNNILELRSNLESESKDIESITEQDILELLKEQNLYKEEVIKYEKYSTVQNDLNFINNGSFFDNKTLKSHLQLFDSLSSLYIYTAIIFNIMDQFSLMDKDNKTNFKLLKSEIIPYYNYNDVKYTLSIINQDLCDINNNNRLLGFVNAFYNEIKNDLYNKTEKGQSYYQLLEDLKRCSSICNSDDKKEDPLYMCHLIIKNGNVDYDLNHKEKIRNLFKNNKTYTNQKLENLENSFTDVRKTDYSVVSSDMSINELYSLFNETKDLNYKLIKYCDIVKNGIKNNFLKNDCKKIWHILKKVTDEIRNFMLFEGKIKKDNILNKSNNSVEIWLNLIHNLEENQEKIKRFKYNFTIYVNLLETIINKHLQKTNFKFTDDIDDTDLKKLKNEFNEIYSKKINMEWLTDNNNNKSESDDNSNPEYVYNLYNDCVKLKRKLIHRLKEIKDFLKFIPMTIYKNQILNFMSKVVDRIKFFEKFRNDTMGLHEDASADNYKNIISPEQIKNLEKFKFDFVKYLNIFNSVISKFSNKVKDDEIASDDEKYANKIDSDWFLKNLNAIVDLDIKNLNVITSLNFILRKMCYDLIKTSNFDISKLFLSDKNGIIDYKNIIITDLFNSKKIFEHIISLCNDNSNDDIHKLIRFLKFFMRYSLFNSNNNSKILNLDENDKNVFQLYDVYFFINIVKYLIKSEVHDKWTNYKSSNSTIDNDFVKGQSEKINEYLDIIDKKLGNFIISFRQKLNLPCLPLLKSKENIKSIFLPWLSKYCKLFSDVNFDFLNNLFKKSDKSNTSSEYAELFNKIRENDLNVTDNKFEEWFKTFVLKVYDEKFELEIVPIAAILTSFYSDVSSDTVLKKIIGLNGITWSEEVIDAVMKTIFSKQG